MTAGLLLAAGLGGLDCATPSAGRRAATDREPIEPPLRRVLRSDGSAAYYLLGSVHHVGRGAPPRFSAVIDRAFARASQLVLEFDPTAPLSESEGERLGERYALIPPPQSLRDRLSSKVLVALDAHLQERGEPLAPYLRYEPWFLVELLRDEAKRSRGLDTASGVERSFAERARRTGKPVVELETAELQYRVLAELPREVHEQRLLDLLSSPEKAGATAEALLEAWERGDETALRRILFAPLEESPDLRVFYERVIFERNERMAAELARLSRDGELRFAVIGAGHLLGPLGIPALLHHRGFRIERKGR